jgi:hypothetical protein
MSSADASAIVARLPAVDGTRSTTAPRSIAMPQPERRAVPQPPAPRRAAVVQARALWAYNEDGQVRTRTASLSSEKKTHTRSVQEQDELSFAAGDVIEIVAKTNNDWWMGKVHGKQALFPANYVEEIPDSSSASEKSGLYAGRSYGAGAHPAAEAPPSNPLGLQAAPGQEEKKKGFGKYKSTVSSLRSFWLQSSLSVCYCLTSSRILLPEALVLVPVCFSDFLPTVR